MQHRQRILHIVDVHRSEHYLTLIKYTKMKSLKILLFFLVAGALFMTSCQEDSFDTTDNGKTDVTPETELVNNVFAQTRTDGNGVELECLTILYSFELELLDGTQVTVASDEDFEDILLNQDTSNYIVDFVYPLTVEDEDDNEVSVADLEELVELFASCIPDDGWGDGGSDGSELVPAFLIDGENSCYELVYPINLVDENGNTVTVADEDEFIDALAANPILFFEFPITLSNDEGDVTINNIEELFAALWDCEEFENPCDSIPIGGASYLGCYQVEFPIELVLVDGSTVTVADEDEFANLLWSGEVAGFVYPLTLTDDEGNVVVVDSDEALSNAINDCYDFEPLWALEFLFNSGPEAGCYEINYPITIGGTVVNNTEEYFQVLETINDPADFEINYPASVTLIDDGSTVTLNSNEDLAALFVDCQG